MKKLLKSSLNRLGYHLTHDHLATLPIPHHSSREGQLLLALAYQQLVADQRALPDFNDAGVRAFSQTNEDGILLLLQAVLGRGHSRVVELGCGNGSECNSTNLILNHGWTGWLFDGNAVNVAGAQKFFARHPDTRIFPPTCTTSWLTRENINQVLADAGVPAEVDVLSLDIDGVDYWIWEALTHTNARIVVLEYNNVVPADLAVTVPYAKDFRFTQPDFMGVSLKAMAQLSRRKGYRLVGCNRLAYNAFFLRDGVGDAFFPEVSVASCLQHPYPQQALRVRYPKVKDCPWVHV
jgi:hypothetical protein